MSSLTTSIGFGRQLSLLLEGDKFQKVKALSSTKEDLLQNNLTKVDIEELLKVALLLLSDGTERVRERSLELIEILLVKDFAESSEVMQLYVPFLVKRIGQTEVLETSEEIRHQLINLLLKGVEKSEELVLFPFLSDIVIVLARSIMDKSPDVKKSSCICASIVAKALPRYFHQHSENLIAPLLIAVTHQHSRIRIVAVKAIADVVQFGNNKSVEDVVPHLAQRLFDQAPAVRKATVQLSGDWLLDLPDRYSFFHRLIPLLMTGFSDDVEEIKELAFQYWDDIGHKFENENEADLKDKLDFPASMPDHYPSGVKRPNLGCRTLMQRNFNKIFPALSNDISDWILETRIKSVQLLYWLFINTEDAITQHLLAILTAVMKAIVDDERIVSKLAIQSCEVISYFVPVEIWCPLALDQVRQTRGSVSSLAMLAALTSGAEPSQLTDNFLCDILKAINDPDVCYTLDVSCQIHIVKCGSAILNVAFPDNIRNVSFELFSLYVSSLAMVSGQKGQPLELADEIGMELEKLGNLNSKSEKNGNGKDLVFAQHVGKLLEKLSSGHEMWNKHSPQRLVFETVLFHSGHSLGQNLNLVISLLVDNLKPEKDAELKLSLFNLLSKLCMKAGETFNSTGEFAQYAHVIVRDGLLPNFVWKPGRTAEGIRLSAVSCLWAIYVQSSLLSRDNVLALKDQLLTQLMSLLSDDQFSTRLVTIRVLKTLFEQVGRTFGQEKLHGLYMDLLKRFDDVNDDIRIALGSTFSAFVDCFDDPYEKDLYKSHVTFIVDTLLIHLDDSNPKVQEAVCEVLKSCSRLNADHLIERINQAKSKHRTTKYLDELLEHISKES